MKLFNKLRPAYAEYRQWIVNPTRVNWCAMSLERIHGNDRQVISAIHRAATRQPICDADFRMIQQMEETGERTLLRGDEIRIVDRAGERRFKFDGSKWNRSDLDSSLSLA